MQIVIQIAERQLPEGCATAAKFVPVDKAIFLVFVVGDVFDDLEQTVVVELL